MDDGYAAGIAAIERARDAGFRFLHVRADGGEVIGIFAQRRRSGAVETFAVTAHNAAHAARYRAEDYQRVDPRPVWWTEGTVAEVLGDLLTLPPHGTPGAPTLTRRPRDDLWLPGDQL